VGRTYTSAGLMQSWKYSSPIVILASSSEDVGQGLGLCAQTAAYETLAGLCWLPVAHRAGRKPLRDPGCPIRLGVFPVRSRRYSDHDAEFIVPSHLPSAIRGESEGCEILILDGRRSAKAK